MPCSKATTSSLKIDLRPSRTIKPLVDQHGDPAAIEAAPRADAMLDKGDLDGDAAWMRIVRAVRELLDREPRGAILQTPALTCRRAARNWTETLTTPWPHPGP